jgi:hypothetical protein
MVAAPWLAALGAVLAALILSYLSLLYRYRRKGRPFRSWRSARWALLIILITAAPAALALALPRVPPAYLGAVVPLTLGARSARLHKRDEPTEYELWYQVITLGVRLLLDRLEQQMEADRDRWVDNVVSRYRSRDQLEDAAARMLSTLRGRASMKPQLTRLKSDFDAVRRNAAEAAIHEYSDPRAADRSHHAAEEAMRCMLRSAYDAGHIDSAVIPWPPVVPQPQRRVPE